MFFFFFLENVACETKTKIGKEKNQTETSDKKKDIRVLILIQEQNVE